MACSTATIEAQAGKQQGGATSEGGQVKKPLAETPDSGKKAPSSVLDQLTEVNRSLFVYRPDPKHADQAATSKSLSYAPPRAILIMGWMDAPLRIVSKYAQPWIERFPAATTIVKLSNGKDFLADKEIQKKYMRSVVEILEDVEKKGDLRDEIGRLEGERAGVILSEDKRTEALKEAEESKADEHEKARGMIVHSFSDGGGSNTVVLLKMLNGQSVASPEDVESSAPSGAANFPEIRATIFDSSPGISTARTASNAFAMHLRRKSFFIWLITKISVYIGIGAALWWKWLLGRKTRSDIMRSALNDARLWRRNLPSSVAAGAGAGAKLPPRMYLYSKNDALIAFEAVEAHAREAATLSGMKTLPQPEDVEGSGGASATPTKTRGAANVSLKRWTTAPHCDIGRSDKDGYWRQIDDFLESVM